MLIFGSVIEFRNSSQFCLKSEPHQDQDHAVGFLEGRGCFMSPLVLHAYQGTKEGTLSYSSNIRLRVFEQWKRRYSCKREEFLYIIFFFLCPCGPCGDGHLQLS